MILSALLTSVAINLGLCLLFFTLYSILRKQPGNINVYVPRFVAEGKVKEGGQFNLERLLPTAGWVRKAWEPTEDEFLSTSGLDAFVFMRMFVFSLKVFTFGAIIGIVLIPINYMGSQLTDDSDFQHKSLDSFSISNVNNGSNRLWIHFSAAYVFTGVVCYLLYYEYRYISSKRIACFYSSEPQPHHFTVLVRGIPIPPGSTCTDAVQRFFSEYHPSTYLSHSVVRRSSKLHNLITDADKLYKKLTNLKQKNDAPKRQTREGCCGLFGPKVDTVDHYERRLGNIEDNVRMEQSSLASKEVPAAFVSFKTRFGAAIALHIQEGVNPTEWITEEAPEPHDVYWPFFTVSFLKRWISKLVVYVAYTTLTVLFLIPVAIVQGLTHLEQLETFFPFLKGVLRLSVVSQVITGYLPSLILQLFLSYVPPTMIMLSSLQGYISWSQIQKSACTKVLLFTIWNIFFANVLSGSALYRVNIFLEPKNIPRVLAEAVPSQASFFIAYVVTSGWTTIASELFRLSTLISNFLSRTFCKNGDDDFEPPSIPYHSEIPRIRLFGLLGVTYFFLAPLILPFLLIYFCLGYIIFRNQFLKVYVPKFETGGEFWPTVHNSTIFSLILMHVIAIGIFGLKKLPLASALTLPLPILTLLFNEYCQKRFRPIFKNFPAECLIKKDRADEIEHNMSEFYDKMENAYNDPALMPVQYSERFDSQRSPLLHSSQF
ncbi:putative calcium-dependent channel, 7TM region phosphate [Medicago truncatula]|uniref:ERD (Early-responsive to dehydration stress) family protein n=1 Tax=Medicago truncatula TaxID=3880 RepID=G7KLA3_MEDTR|nr:CSC1-like protein HYP1 [Medicago truncatula]AES74766.2 ERD (early-responsive to dehydration stress) family protein [Medicago truncatula]RHN50088.1 putative calcium-dependent channel, 7TM region phosphate [Medicago truncatula]